MKTTREDLMKLLQALDRDLTVKAQLLLIDFPSLILAYCPGTSGTENVVDPVDQLRTIHGIASSKLHIQIPFQSMAVSELPFLFETRLITMDLPAAKKIKVDVVDRHDAVIAKILRNEKREIDAIAKMGSSAGLAYNSLLDSFCAIDSTSCDMLRVRQQFLELVELVFGETSVTQAEALIAERMG